MNKSAITIEDALNIAIQEEVKAYNLYIDTIEKVTNTGTKTMLNELAEQELGHQKQLIGIIKNKKYENLGENVPADMPGITNFLLVSELQENATPQDVMIFAMMEEEKAMNFYTDLKNHFAGSELESIFKKLAAEEKGHKAKLENEYEAHFMMEN
ncbi:ferritin family protein [candidate division KSB1 bacterium]|nr:ferritin family protein [candidate division KSB1 bacterium]